MALGAEVSLGGEQRGAVSSIAPADMVTAFRYVFAAAAALMAGATLLMVLMAGGDGGVGGPPAKHTGAGPRRKPKVARRAARVLRIWRSAIVAAG
jgi:hypothetical protein